MEWHTASKLSAHQHETAEGYLICRDVPIARTGTQIYWENEVPPLQGDVGGRVHVDREASEVFHPDSIRSFEGKPLVDDHPWEPVGPDNWNDLVIGYVANARRGDGVHDDLLLADLIFTTRKGIDAVKRGKRAISVGYNAFYEQTAPGLGRQKSIFCNHVALVDEGRCGARCTILDGKTVYNYNGIVSDDFDPNQPRVPGGNPKGGEFASTGGGGGGAAAHHLPAKTVNGQRVTASGEALPPHITKLRIPPAWTEVTYSPDPGAALLATGRDAKGRRQPIYSAEHHAKSGAEKFARVKALAARFDAITKANEKARKSKDPATADAADAAALIMHTGMRPGSDADTGADVKGYGATTLEGRHVISTKQGVKLRFVPGKKHGETIEMPVSDPDLAKMLIRRKTTAGSQGRLFPATNAGALRHHVHSLGDFKTKDFRTHLGTQTAIEAIKATPEPSNPREYKRAVRHVAGIVSDKLGNTPAIALASYISPVVFAAWQQHAGMTGDAAFEDADDLPDAHWGEVGARLPEPKPPGIDEPDDDGEDITAADPDVIAMLGFDPFEFEDENDIADDWHEQPRVPKGSPAGGEFGSGGGGGGREGRYQASKGEHGVARAVHREVTGAAKKFTHEDYHLVAKHFGEADPAAQRKALHKQILSYGAAVVKSHLKEEKHHAVHAVHGIRAVMSGKRPSPDQMKGLRSVALRATMVGASTLIGDPTGSAGQLAAAFAQDAVQHVLVEHAIKAVAGAGRAVAARLRRDAEPNDDDDDMSDDDKALLLRFIEAIADAIENLGPEEAQQIMENTEDVDYDADADIDFSDDWNEEEHPRVPKGSPGGGQFGKGGGGGGRAESPSGASEAPSRAAEILAELDKRKAPDIEYKKAFSTGAKQPLKPGETWRGRLQQWVASERQRVDPEHIKNVPEPSKHGGHPGKLLVAVARQGLEAGDDPKDIAAKIKEVAARYAHPLHERYANQLIAHLEKAHDLKPGELGKAQRRIDKPEPPPEPSKPPPPPPPAPKPVAKPPAARPTPTAKGKLPESYEAVRRMRPDWAAGEAAYHDKAWDEATPELLGAMRNVKRLTEVRINKEGGFYQGGRHFINMPKTGIDSAHSPDALMTWRHEYGHAMDYNGQWTTQSRRAEQDRQQEAKALIAARRNMTETDPTAVKAGLENSGLPFEEIREFTAGYNHLANHVAAVLGGDLSKAPMAVRRNKNLSGTPFVPDQRKFQDFLGAMTDNVIGSGHEAKYYQQARYRHTAEMFANYVALTNGPGGKIYKPLLHAIAPKCCKHFDDIIQEVSNG